ncbi:MAG: efflux RND transporter permease subunit [Flavobacteriales bacterium]|nr:efflux RND transporter permease subunit [Flavobacteriales bacterium]
MIDKVIKFSIHNKAIIGLFTLVLVLYGAYSSRSLPIDVTVPDITNNQGAGDTTTPTLAAQEVEQFVTRPSSGPWPACYDPVSMSLHQPLRPEHRHHRVR